VPAATTSVILAQAADPTGGLLLPVLLFAAIYLLLIRPQSRRRKEQQRLISALRPGDLVVTIGGIHGEVADLGDGTVDLVLSRDDADEPDVVVRFDRAAVARLVERAGGDGGAEVDAGPDAA
jgi:preprotein translocase subunit YajC